MKLAISIIIPTLNEEKNLKRTIEVLLRHAHQPSLIEILIVDAGSTDRTLESIRDLNVRIFSQPEFLFKKYKSLNFGIEKSRGDLLLFLDADTLLPLNFDLWIRSTLEKKSCVGGAFNFSFDRSNAILWIAQTLNKVRYGVSKIYFGDQAVFCKKSIALKVGGFPKKSLMETAYFCKQLKKEGKLSLIKKNIITSSRRFEKEGTMKVLYFDFIVWIRFVLGWDIDSFGKKYWKHNVNNS